MAITPGIGGPCWEYQMKYTLMVEYTKNKNTPFGTDWEGEVSLITQMIGPGQLANKWCGDPATPDVTPHGDLHCPQMCEHNFLTHSFTGTDCEGKAYDGNLGAWLKATRDTCAPDISCPGAASWEPGQPGCTARYKLRCHKKWITCTREDDLEAYYSEKVGRTRSIDLQQSPWLDEDNAIASWKMLELINLWQRTPGPECTICKVICCLCFKGMYPGGAVGKSKEDCSSGLLGGGLPVPGLPFGGSCEYNLGEDWRRWIVRMCDSGECNPPFAPPDPINLACLGCCDPLV